MGPTPPSYEPDVVERFAAQLERRARTLVVGAVAVGAVGGAAVGAVPLTPLETYWDAPGMFSLATILFGGLAGSLIGYVVGSGRAALTRLHAQTILCQLHAQRATLAIWKLLRDREVVETAPAEREPVLAPPVPAEPQPEPIPAVAPAFRLPTPEPPTFAPPPPEPMRPQVAASAVEPDEFHSWLSPMVQSPPAASSFVATDETHNLPPVADSAPEQSPAQPLRSYQFEPPYSVTPPAPPVRASHEQSPPEPVTVPFQPESNPMPLSPPPPYPEPWHSERAAQMQHAAQSNAHPAASEPLQPPAVAPPEAGPLRPLLLPPLAPPAAGSH